MYNPLLKTFVVVADCGSFLKASDELFISAPAVMKQINQLEKHLDLTLIKRSNKGIELTVEGKSIYNDAKKMIQLSNDAINRAHSIRNKQRYQIRVGSSMLYPASVLMEIWNKISGSYPNFHLKIIPFEDSETGSATYVVGSKCDIVVGAYDATQDRGGCSFLALGDYKFCLAMSHAHKLATKKTISPAELVGEKLLIMKEGNSPRNDEVRQLLQDNYPDVILEDVPIHYGLNHFNRCEEENCLLLTLDGWKNIHPSLMTIPFDVNVKLPYGVLYSNNSSKFIKDFIQILSMIAVITTSTPDL